MKNNHGNFHGRSPRGFGGNSRPSRWGGSSRYGNRSRSAALDPAMFVNKAQEVKSQVYEPVNSFADFGLDEAVKRNILTRGFDRPTLIQDKAIGAILEGKDLVGIADTGTGKTAAFLLPLITKAIKNRGQKVLVVVPTRELAAQISDQFRLFAVGTGVYSVTCTGGSPAYAQIQGLRRGADFVVGTPGRIKDFINRRILDVGRFETVVLDEVDRMLDMGFVQDIKEIVSYLPRERQTLFFSATMPEKTKVLMQQFLKDPVTISVKSANSSQNIDQDIVRVGSGNKVEILHQLLIKKEFCKVLVFGRTKRGVSDLEEKLITRGFSAVAIHGNKSQGQRTRALRMLKENRVQILIATDVASRGIDVEDITHVINYDIPETREDYTHRIGRTGRAGKKGVALTFVN